MLRLHSAFSHSSTSQRRPQPVWSALSLLGARRGRGSRRLEVAAAAMSVSGWRRGVDRCTLSTDLNMSAVEIRALLCLNRFLKVLLGIFNKDLSRNVVGSSNVSLLVPGMLSAGVQEQDNDRAREEQQTAAQSRHCSLDSADRRAASASTVTQLHCTVDICRFIELPPPLQQNTETHIPAQPSPATSTSTRNFLVRFLDRVART